MTEDSEPAARAHGRESGHAGVAVSGIVAGPLHLPNGRVDRAGEGALSIFNLGKSYGGRAVVQDVSISLRRGEAVGLLGPNGAGKTTVFYMITGLVRPDKGVIELDGYDVTRLPMYQRARLGIGYLPQEASIFRGMSVEDNIRAVLEISEPDRGARARTLEALLEEFDIARLRKAPSIALSGGERRRCEIARALAGKPSFMLLDEPFAGVDVPTRRALMQRVSALAAAGTAVVVTTHRPGDWPGCATHELELAGGRARYCGPLRPQSAA